MGRGCCLPDTHMPTRRSLACRRASPALAPAAAEGTATTASHGTIMSPAGRGPAHSRAELATCADQSPASCAGEGDWGHAAPPSSVQTGCSRLPSCVRGRGSAQGASTPQIQSAPRRQSRLQSTAGRGAQEDLDTGSLPGATHLRAGRRHWAPELGPACPPWLSSSFCPRRAGCAVGAPPYVPVLGGAPGGRRPEDPPWGELGPKAKDRVLHGAAGRGLPAGGRPGPEANEAGISHRATPQPRALGICDSAARGTAPRRPWSPQ